VTRFVAKVQKLGGKVSVPKTAVPQMGYFAICQDTENNVFALWERNEKAK
jgi:predicted enzyme related to lactoylglutathione lyase